MCKHPLSHGDQFYNIAEKDYFLEKHNLPKLTQEEIENMSSPIAIREISFIIMIFPTKNTPGPHFCHW